LHGKRILVTGVSAGLGVWRRRGILPGTGVQVVGRSHGVPEPFIVSDPDENLMLFAGPAAD